MSRERNDIRSAELGDDAALRRLLRETPLPGGISVTLEREPSFFGADVDVIRHDTVWLDGAGCGSRLLKRAWWNGEEADVAYIFNQYHLISCPVVDGSGRLVGVITIDDAMNVLDEEHEEDILRLAGVGDESLSDRVFDTAKLRFVWLFVNLLTAILASVVIGLFADEIETYVALAVLMPIVASMGGNAGTQSMTVAVRSIATRDLTVRNAWRVIRREIAVGALNGLGFGLIMAAVAGVWFGVPMLSLVIAIAMLLTLVAAALGGIVIPILLDRFGVDPALASGPFVTTVTDVVGFFAFLGLAAVLLL